MAPDYDIQSGARRCARTGRALGPSDRYFSVLEEGAAGLVRTDFSPEAWEGAPAEAVAWWESQPADAAGQKRRPAPNETLLRLFDAWADQPEMADARYVLALLLVRRRVFQEEARPLLLTSPGDPHEDQRAARGVLCVYCPRRDESYEVPEALPDGPRVAEIQSQLSELLAA